MIERVTFKNFKALRDVSIDLERFTVLVGPNASGKSSVLEGLDIMSKLSEEVPDLVLNNARQPNLLASRGSTEPCEISEEGREITGFRLSIIPPNFRVTGRHAYKPLQSAQGWNYCIRYSKPGSNGDWALQDGSNDGGKMPPRSAAHLHLNPSFLGHPTYSHTSPPKLGQEGQYLASTLAYRALNQPDEFPRLQDGLRRIIPTVVRVRFDKVSVIQDFGNGPVSLSGEAIIFDCKGANGIPANLASEGTLYVLALLTLLYDANRPDLILLDDIDRGLHPKAQRELVALLRELLAQDPKLQIVATTHSPYWLHWLKPEEVRCMTLADDGTASCAPLMAHPQFEKWKDEMTPGEMWSLFGEKWAAAKVEEEVAV